MTDNPETIAEKPDAEGPCGFYPAKAVGELNFHYVTCRCVRMRSET